MIQVVMRWSEHTASGSVLTSIVYTVHAFVYIAGVSIRAVRVLLQKC